MQSLKNGTELGAYRIVRLIGRGGMGEVYEAFEHRLERRVALKVIAPQKAGTHGEVDLIRRFLQEARTLAQVNHPNVVTIYAIDRIGDTQFIAMEFVDGASFKDIFSLFALSGDEAAPIFLQLLEGLRSLHDNRILHRDIKPHNLMMRPNGQIKILDFGIAKRLGDRERDNTTAGVVVGTLAYLPPEVLYGTPASARSDLWSLGAIFYEAMVGHPLVSMHTIKIKGVKGAAESDVVFPQEVLGWIPPQMRAIVAKLCDRRPDLRYQNASEAIDAMKRYQLSRPPLAPGVYPALCRAIEDIEDVKRRADIKTPADATSKRALTLSLLSGTVINVVETADEGMDDGPVEVTVDSLSARRRVRRARRFRDKWRIPAAVMAGALVLGAVTFKIVARSRAAAKAAAEAAAVEMPRLESPAENQTLWLDPTQIPTLSWSAMVASGEYELQIATDTNFNSIVVREPVTGTSYRPGRVLPEGDYNWQLWPMHGTQKPIGPGHFTISVVGTLEAVWPKANQTFEIPENEKQYGVNFAWKCKPGAKTYRAQVSSDEAFTAPLQDQVIASCAWNDVKLPAGSYFWRVRIEDPVEGQASSSPKQNFEIKPEVEVAPAPVPPVATVERPLGAPRIKNPEQTVVLLFKKPLNARDLASLRKQLIAAPVLRWQAVYRAQKYNLQISWNADFSRLFSEHSVAASHFDWTQAVPGHFFWRVRAVNGAAAPGPYSPTAAMTVNLPAPGIGSVYTFTEKAPFEWEAVPLAEKYIVQSSVRRDLAGATEIVTSGPQASIGFGKDPVYLRVAAANAAGERVGGFSQVATVTLEGPLRLSAPGLVTPPKGAKVVLGNSGRISIVFSWTDVEGAGNYMVEISGSPKFERIIQHKAVKANHWLLKGAKFNGRIYWHVRTEGGGNHSKWSSPGEFEVR